MANLIYKVYNKADKKEVFESGNLIPAAHLDYDAWLERYVPETFGVKMAECFISKLEVKEDIDKIESKEYDITAEWSGTTVSKYTFVKLPPKPIPILIPNPIKDGKIIEMVGE